MAILTYYLDSSLWLAKSCDLFFNQVNYRHINYRPLSISPELSIRDRHIILI